MAEIKIPAVGESISTALISNWHKKDGDSVGVGDVLLTLETDKVATDLTADSTGVLKIKIPAGQEVPIGAVVGSIEPGPIGASAPAESAPPAAPKEKGGARAKESTRPGKGEIASHQKPSAPETPVAPEAPTKAAPAAAAGNDVVAPVPEPAPRAASSDSPELAPAARAHDGRTTRRRMSPMRRKIAQQLVNAQHTAAMLTTINEADMSAVMKLRKDLQESFIAKHGIKLGLMSFFVKAAVDALKSVPQVNSRIDGDDIVENHFFDIGVAVSTERGLMVPVIRDCDQKSFSEIERAIGDVAARARDGKVQLEDLQGGIFTITNGGIFGSLLSTPILNPPQSGILGMHTIQERPVARDGQVIVRPMMYLALSYDHRVVDGKDAVTFLIRIKECIENPARLLLGT
ncbi:MAG: 2-oxoglutarate dehydrogenase complex dihydrolipoyllysine-residue succinyltransferase [Verrucomicrobiales bacterium]